MATSKPPDYGPGRHFASDNHAWLMGNVAGAMLWMVAQAADVSPTEVHFITDGDGNYTNQVRIARASGTYLLTLEAEE